MPIRVVVVDDHAFVRAAVVGVLSGAEGIEVVGECGDGTEVLGVAARTRPDVVVMDVRMPSKSGPAATRELMALYPFTKVMMLTGSLKTAAIEESVQAGAVGFLLKGDPDALVDAVRYFAAGGAAWPADLTPAPV